MYNEKALSMKAPYTITGQAQTRFHGINIKRLLTDALLWIAVAVFNVLGSANVNDLRQYPSISLRYETPFTGQAAYQARQYSIEHADEDSFWLTYWRQAKASFEGEYNTASATCIYFSGDASLVWPARYMSGGSPGVTDGSGCSVSSALAASLWGGTDVAGKSIEVGGETRTVRGVFEEEELLALVSVRDEDKTQSFTCVELSGGPDSPSRSDAESFVKSAGLGSPDSVLMGTFTSLATGLSALPLVILGFYALALCLVYLKSFPIALRGGLFLALIALAFLLPGILDTLPSWMIPTRWSDFSFWSGLFDQISGNLREYLLLTPKLRDVAYKTLLLKQILLAFPAVGCALSICFRWHGKRKLILSPYK